MSAPVPVVPVPPVPLPEPEPPPPVPVPPPPVPPPPVPEPPPVGEGLGAGAACAEKTAFPVYPEEVTSTGTTRMAYVPAAFARNTDSLDVPAEVEEPTSAPAPLYT